MITKKQQQINNNNKTPHKNVKPMQKQQVSHTP